MKSKWIIITLLFTLLIGGLKSSPVLASRGNELTFFERVGLYRDNNQMAFSHLSNSLISLAGANQYLLPSKLVQSHDSEIKQLAFQLTEGLNNDEEKSLAIYTWVATNITYDTEEYFGNPENPRYYTALETLENKIALCSGYANLNAALHRAVGIEARVVYGEGHAWNEVKLLGQWQEQDPTYGSGGLNLERRVFVQQFKNKYFSNADLRKDGEFPW